MTEAATPLKTAEQARAWFDEQGISIAEWCRQHGFSPALTREILAGGRRRACTRGMSHQIAVMLGMKKGVITRSPDQARQGGRSRRAPAVETAA
jgi:gp16 family phage-associated protein